MQPESVLAQRITRDVNDMIMVREQGHLGIGGGCLQHLEHGGSSKVVGCYEEVFANQRHRIGTAGNRADPTGKKAHASVTRDPLDVLRHFVPDDRIDVRYRERILRPAIARIERQRSAWGRILEALSLRKSAEKMDDLD